MLDRDGRPVRGQLVEVWQANASGRYAHQRDDHPAPLDPNFTGVGRCLTDDQGAYEFVTVKPGAYPWRNHVNAWRPAHIHFSLFGNAFTQRLITQMYFPGDPLFAYDPILQSVTDDSARRMARRDVRPRPVHPRMVARLPLGHRPRRSRRHLDRGGPLMSTTPSQTVGPFYGYALPFAKGGEIAPPDTPMPSPSTATSTTAPGLRSPTPSSRSGSPHPTAHAAARPARCAETPSPERSSAGPMSASPASAASGPTRTATTSCVRCRPAASPTSR